MTGGEGMAGPITRNQYFELGHVTARVGKARTPAFHDAFMRCQKQLRRIEVAGPSFLSLPGLIVGSKRVATMHRSHAAMIADTMPMTVRELAFDIPPIREAPQWHISNNNDTARVGFQVRVIAVVAQHSVDFSRRRYSVGHGVRPGDEEFRAVPKDQAGKAAGGRRSGHNYPGR